MCAESERSPFFRAHSSHPAIFVETPLVKSSRVGFFQGALEGALWLFEGTLLKVCLRKNEKDTHNFGGPPRLTHTHFFLGWFEGEMVMAGE